MSGWRKRLLERTVIAFAVVTLIFSQYFAMVFDEKNRYFMHWSSTDAWVLITVVSFLAMVGVCISVLVDAARSEWLTKISQHVFVLALVSGLLTLYQFSWRSTGWIPVIWLPIMALIGFSLGYPGSRLVLVARALALIMSPLVPILFVQTLALSTWHTPPQERIAFEEPDEPKTPVFFLLFDGWSYPKSTIDGEFHSYFENLRRITSKAFVFRRARSPGTTTKVSLPMILYQKEIQFTDEKEIFKPWFQGSHDGESQLSSLFDRARTHGYETALLGCYFPYARIFENEVDYCYAKPYEAGGQEFFRRAVKVCVHNLRYLNDPISQRLDRRLGRMVHSRRSYESARSYFDEARWILKHSSSNTFVFFHIPFPHWPYVFNSDGTYFGHQGEDYRGSRDEAGYVRHLKYLDKIVGDMVTTLQESGRFEESMIILTSDHASALEVGVQENRLHVPLIIKLPGQQNSHVIDRPMKNNEIGPIIESVLKGNADERQILTDVQAPVSQDPSG